MELKVGHIDYLNCVPFFHYLNASGFSGETIKGVPAVLNQLLRRGQIDVCPSSSFEYGQHWRDYSLLPYLGISSFGPVGSVLLFSANPLDQLKNTPIAVTGESATSVNLLRVLLREYYGFECVNDYVPQSPIEQVFNNGEPTLLIGDRALLLARKTDPACVFDLGELWYRFTGKAFVFALWMIRQPIVQSHAEPIRQLIESLHQSKQKAWEQLDHLADLYAQQHWMTATELSRYWRMMEFNLSSLHLDGLRYFFKLCCKHGLLAENPPLRFFSSEQD